MRFTRLRLNGFKSFVDPTDLLIAEGLTGVVGPNGCGKSNLLEALRWVMGENRPTAMRGDGMEDVIFAGAATRPARNYAEVALTIDNSERLAPAGFTDADTLDVVRRIMVPQMVLHALPGFTNNWLVMVKATALVSIIGLDDMVHRASLASAATNLPFTFYAAIAAIYLAITTVSLLALKLLERRFSLGVRRSEL